MRVPSSTATSTATAIEANGVGIEFAINRRARRRLRDVFIHGRTGAHRDTFWALRDVSFSVAKGESVGIIGGNGSGKSSLLKLIAGVLLPDTGSIRVNGDIAPLIQLGAGFSQDLSARENVFLSGTILGLTRETIQERFDEIVDFAEIRKFLDTPLKHFSSGMKVRLGFSIMMQVDAPIMLIDEVLAVGDRRFREKSYKAMTELLAKDRTLLLVSHSDADIQKFCERGIYLRNGELVADGEVRDVLDRYARDSDARK